MAKGCSYHIIESDEN